MKKKKKKKVAPKKKKANHKTPHSAPRATGANKNPFKMKTNKVFLELKSKEFNNAKAIFEKKQIAKSKLYAELLKLTGEAVEPDESIENNPLQYFYDWLVEKHKDSNPMSLKALKLIDLLEIDLAPFKDAIAKNNAIANIPEPNEEDFKIFAETPEELARLQLSTDLVSVIQRTKKVIGLVSFSTLSPIVRFDGGINDYVVNNDFIKSKFYKNVL